MKKLGQCGPYTLERWVAAGGMGEIFLSQGPTPRGPGPAAVKRLLPSAKDDPTFVQMFLDEGRLARLLRHPNICAVYDLGEDDGQYFIAMEWADGVSLEQLITRSRGRGGLAVEAVARIIADIANALDYAHRFRDDQDRFLAIVHRDVSPPNIMVGLRGRVKLLDFGLAKARSQLTKTQPGTVKGKFGYLAPEQLTGDVDARTDVFALGLCMYEAMTGEAFFNQETAAETVTNIRAYTSPPSAAAKRREVWPELDAVIKRALWPRRELRFQSAGEMRNAIEQALVDRREQVDAKRLEGVVRELFPEKKPLGDSVAPPPAAPAGGIPSEAELEALDDFDDLDLIEDAGAKKSTALVVGVVVAAVVLLGGAAAFLLL